MTTESTQRPPNASTAPRKRSGIQAKARGRSKIAPSNGSTKVKTKPLYHVYLVHQRGASLMRLNTYYDVNYHGQRPAAWKSRSTAFYWGQKIAPGERFLVLQCLANPGECSVCKKFFEDNTELKPEED